MSAALMIALVAAGAFIMLVGVLAGSGLAVGAAKRRDGSNGRKP